MNEQEVPQEFVQALQAAAAQHAEDERRQQEETEGLVRGMSPSDFVEMVQLNLDTTELVIEGLQMSEALTTSETIALKALLRLTEALGLTTLWVAHTHGLAADGAAGGDASAASASLADDGDL